MQQLSIGAAAKASGVKVPTIRFYEEIGLLPSPPPTTSNRRLYGEDELNRLLFIRHTRELGFDLDAIRALIALQAKPQNSCAEVDAIASLSALKTELQRMINGCRRGQIRECHIIEALKDHAECRHHDVKRSAALRRR